MGYGTRAAEHPCEGIGVKTGTRCRHEAYYTLEREGAGPWQTAHSREHPRWCYQHAKSERERRQQEGA